MTKTIEDILKELPLDESVKTSLKATWTAALADARVAQEANIKEALSTRYDNDIEKMHEAFGTFLEERIKPHVEELQEGVASVDAMKQAYAAKTAKIKEAAETYVKRRMGALEKVIEAHIRKELAELHEDVVANRRAALNAITEKTAELERERQQFRAKAAKVIENIINVKVPAQLDELREDIMAARQDNFGREMFEAFQTMFRRQFFNTSGEFKKLVNENKALAESEKATRIKAAKAVKESREEALASKQALNKLTENVSRQQTMARLLQPLTGTARVQMKALLEATKTDKLEATFSKALPQLARESKAPVRSQKPLTETKAPKVQQVEFRSGGTNVNESADYDEFDDELSNLRRLAGNK